MLFASKQLCQCCKSFSALFRAKHCEKLYNSSASLASHRNLVGFRCAVTVDNILLLDSQARSTLGSITINRHYFKLGK